MADYQPLGIARGGSNTAALDETGRNGGNLTNALTGSFIGINVPVFECYHMVVTNVPVGSMAQIYVNTNLYSFTFPFQGSEWDPSQPMSLRPGDEIDFLWNTAAPGTAGQIPIVTAFFRFDTALPVNRSYATQG